MRYASLANGLIHSPFLFVDLEKSVTLKIL